MELIFLGTGTSEGVPLIAHPNEGLDLKNRKNWRTRSAVHVRMGGQAIQVDAGPEFRLQCLENGVEAVDVFLLTHEHADHVMGMDDLRRFCWDEALPVYAGPSGCARIKAVFPYALGEKPEVRGYPCFDLRQMPKVLELDGGRVHSVELPHGRFTTLGFVFEENGTGRKIAYYNDCNALTDEALALARGADVVVLDALRPTPHRAHMTVEQAIGYALELGARQTYLTHMTYMVDYETASAELPEAVFLAYDGLKLTL